MSWVCKLRISKDQVIPVVPVVGQTQGPFIHKFSAKDTKVNYSGRPKMYCSKVALGRGEAMGGPRTIVMDLVLKIEEYRPEDPTVSYFEACVICLVNNVVLVEGLVLVEGVVLRLEPHCEVRLRAHDRNGRISSGV